MFVAWSDEAGAKIMSDVHGLITACWLQNRSECEGVVVIRRIVLGSVKAKGVKSRRATMRGEEVHGLPRR